MNIVSTISCPKKIPAMAEATSSNISVAVRIRPPSTKEQECVRATSASAIVALSTCATKHDQVFEFDTVFGPQATQEEVYAGTVGNLIKDKIYKGFNGTILAYGQTGSGESRFSQS